ncbi:MAG: hypothetical protein M3077_07640 [Candidatus Dormibacteraeota bacterium]|nr:hypothetical protein [Candidatus Dormibacteraeota bacterium]MDQ6884093.1 hypothetical protein [Candidatus Dormibacteraeota bacterium]
MPPVDAARGELTAAERSFLRRRLNTPMRIQEYLDGLEYNTEADGETFRSPRRVLRDETGNCIEGAVLAAAALRVQGQPPLIMDLTAVHDEDHVLAVFKRDRCWGAIGTSKFTGLRFREPVYRTLRELAMSYFEHYYNLRGERTLRGHGRPVNLRRFDRLAWMTTEKDLWPIAEHLERIPHVALITPAMGRKLSPLDARLKAAGLSHHPSVRH